MRESGEIFQAVELILDAFVGVLDRDIESWASRGDGRVVSAEGLLNREGEEAVVAGGDRADVFGSVVDLDGDLSEFESGSTEVIEAEDDEFGVVEGGEMVGILDESGGDHI